MSAEKLAEFYNKKVPPNMQSLNQGITAGVLQAQPQTFPRGIWKAVTNLATLGAANIVNKDSGGCCWSGMGTCLRPARRTCVTMSEGDENWVKNWRARAQT